jgi:hypothetical protein
MNTTVKVTAELELRPLSENELDSVAGGFRPVATPMMAHSMATDGVVGYLVFRLGWGQNG